jgi:hypothetical protein
MIKVPFIVVPLILCTVLLGCCYPYPTNLMGTKIIASYTITCLGLRDRTSRDLSDTLIENLLTGYTSSIYFYSHVIEDIGTHELRLVFYQNNASHSWTWKIPVSAPLTSSESEEAQQGLE